MVFIQQLSYGEDIETLIDNLDNDSWHIRERAKRKIIEYGSSALPILYRNSNNRSIEVRENSKALFYYILYNTNGRFFMDRSHDYLFIHKKQQIIDTIINDPRSIENIDNIRNLIMLLYTQRPMLCYDLCYDIWFTETRYHNILSNRAFLYKYMASGAVYSIENIGPGYNRWEEALIEGMEDAWDEVTFVTQISRIKTLRVFLTLLKYYVVKVKPIRNRWGWLWRNGWDVVDWDNINDLYASKLAEYPPDYIELIKYLYPNVYEIVLRKSR